MYQQTKTVGSERIFIFCVPFSYLFNLCFLILQWPWFIFIDLKREGIKTAFNSTSLYLGFTSKNWDIWKIRNVVGKIPGILPCEEACHKVTLRKCSKNSFYHIKEGNTLMNEVKKEWKRRNYQLCDEENSGTGIGTYQQIEMWKLNK